MASSAKGKPMTETTLWRAVETRDDRFDDQFVYAVRTTGIFCRPSCSSRRPKRGNVAFYESAGAARAAGFRACKKCRPEGAADAPDVILARAVAAEIDAADERVPTLAELADAVGASGGQVQRVFARVMGLSPKAYGDARREARFRARLKAGDDIAGALYEAGYGAPSRVYESAKQRLGMTPATYKKGGAGARIRYALADCALGRVIVGATDSGVCFVGLSDDDRQLETELRGDFPAAEIVHDGTGLGPWVAAVVDQIGGRVREADLPLDVCATAFQRRVWQALTDIPYGETMTYKEIAAYLGQPKAARAVGRACATNPVSIVVPCHRALGSDGALHGYRWGLDRKAALLETEGRDGA